MIKTVRISNFKSVQELEIELGRLNVFIGENGCGKTSILEGIAFGGAAIEGNVDEGLLETRGVRITESPLMKSAFKKVNGKRSIEIAFSNSLGKAISYRLNKKSSIDAAWNIQDQDVSIKEIIPVVSNAVSEDVDVFKLLTKVMIEAVQNGILTLDSDGEVSYIEERLDELMQGHKTKKSFQKLEKTSQDFFADYKAAFFSDHFLICSPENFFLRNFREEGQIRPLGIRGEGLFRHLVELSKEEPETFAAISNQLSLIDWFGGLSIPNNLQFTERRIAITDRFIADTIKEFDQRSANEGFLYLLFYFTLFLSKYTPKFFAIDNIDNSLNPKLCAKLVEVLAKLSQENDKQAILTTHNPAILDGLDLTDDEQRLFVIYRNADGETKARRVKPLKKVEGVEEVRLSEAFVRGYLGGLPKNF